MEKRQQHILENHFIKLKLTKPTLVKERNFDREIRNNLHDLSVTYYLLIDE